MEEQYRSLRTAVSSQIKVEGSRFIADAFPITGSEDAEEHLAAVRKKYFDATHHCYAFLTGPPALAHTRASDDGEPSGTAGVKILSALRAADCSDALIVVTRYFGGTKLGVGGLGRAYHDAASSVLSSASYRTKALVQELAVSFPFTETNPVMTLVHGGPFRILGTDYSEDRTIITLGIFPSQVEALRLRLTNATRAQAELTTGPTRTILWD